MTSVTPQPPIEISSFCDNLLRHIFDEATDCIRENSNRDTCISDLQTLARISHVDRRWRSVVLGHPRLWARNVVISRSVNVNWVAEVVRRAQTFPISLHIFDSCHGLNNRDIWCLSALLVKIISRCVYLHFEQTVRADPLGFVLWNAAPALQDCRIVCTNPSQVHWRPLFKNSAPNLEALHLTNVFAFSGNFPNVTVIQLAINADLPISTLIALSQLPRLTRLELRLPNTSNYESQNPFLLNVAFLHLECLTLSGTPPSIARILSSISLLSETHILLELVFDPNQMFTAETISPHFWQVLLQHFASPFDFPSCILRCEKDLVELGLIHTNGQRFDVTFNHRAMHLPKNCTIPLYFPILATRSRGALDKFESLEIMYAVIWMTLRLYSPKLLACVKTVTIPGPEISAPRHLHHLFSTMVSVENLHFINIGTTFNLSWSDFLQELSLSFEINTPVFPLLKLVQLPEDTFGGTELAFRRYIQFRDKVGHPIETVKYGSDGPQLYPSVAWFKLPSFY